MNKERKKLLLSLLLIGGCAAVAIVFRSSVLDVEHPAHAKEAGGGRAASPVSYVTPSKDDIQKTVRMSAEVRPSREAMIYGKVSGYVLPHPVEVGTRVDPTGAGGATKVLLRIAVPDLDAKVVTEASRVARAEAGIAEAAAHVAEADAAVIGAQQGAAEAEALARQASGMIRAAEANVVEARAELNLRERIAGRLEKVLADSPNLVAQDQVDQARGGLEIAKAKFDGASIGVKKARDDEAVAVARVAAAKARITAARAMVTAAKAQVTASEAQAALAAAHKHEVETMRGFGTIYAPFAGVVAERMIDTGDLVKDATSNSGAKPLFRIVADDKLRVRFFVADPDAPTCRVGSRVDVTIDVIPDKTFEARVSRVADALDAKTRTMEVEAELDNPRDENGKKLLRADMFARVRVYLAVSKDAMVLPARCVLTKKRKSSVMVIGEGDRVKIVPVVIGFDDGVRIEIKSGIDANTRVVLRGRNTVSKGEKVVAHKVDAPEVGN